MRLTDPVWLTQEINKPLHNTLWHNRAYALFEKIGLPDKRNELYRYAGIEKILDRPYERLKNEETRAVPGKRLCITNGALSEFPESANVSIHINATEVHYDPEHADPLYHLGHVMCERVIRIEIDSEFQQTSLPIVHRLCASGEIISYRVELIVAPEVNVDVIETFEGECFENSLMLYGFNVSVANHAGLSFYRVQSGMPKGAVLGSHSMKLHESSKAYLHLFDRDVSYAFHTYAFHLRGEEAVLDFDSVASADKEEVIGNVLEIHHDASRCRSNQMVRQILDGHSHGIFDGKVIVSERGRDSVANQLSKALLLSDEAGIKMAVKPQLEIYIDELEASHGASIGNLDKEQLFYLRSRGLDRARATQIMTEAFIREIFERIENERIRNDLLQTYGLGDTSGENFPV